MNKTNDGERKKAARRSIEPPPKERFELLMEQVLDRVNVIGEGHSALRNELAEFRSEVKEELREVNFKIAVVAKDLTAHRAETKANFAVTNGKIDAVARDLKEHRADSAAHLVVH